VPRARNTTTSATPRRTYDPEQTRGALLSAAIDLFGTKGFHGTSVQEIVNSAELTKGAFYHHFESKEDVLRIIHDEFIDSHLERQQRIVEQFDGAHERLFHLIRLLVFVVAEYRPQVFIFFQERRVLQGDAFNDLYAKRDAALRTYTDTIAMGVERGEFRADANPEVSALGVVGMCDWMYQWYRPGGGRSPEEIGAEFAAMALHGLTARPRSVKALLARPIPDPDPAREDLPASAGQLGA
jgi:AcrR family transcriptional regulator